MIKIFTSITKNKSMRVVKILFGTCFLGIIEAHPRQLYFCSRAGIVSLENSSIYYLFDKSNLDMLVYNFEYVDMEVTLKEFTKVV
jgi:hypothetical protein